MKINLQLFAATKTDEEIAREVIAGKWGNGTTRKNNLTQAGYNASNVQNVVNAMLNGSYKPTKTTAPATTAPATTAPKSYQYEEFKYDPYTESDTVKQANAMLQEHMANKPGEFQYLRQDYLDDIYNKVMNREDFSYDLNGDVLYQQYKDQYTTQGKLAMMDTMGQAAAMTGGYGNSYTQAVGQQAYQGYLQQLNDKVPELYQLALNQYNQEGQDLYNQAALLAQEKEQDYGRYRDAVSDFYTNLDYLTGRADKEAATDYERWSDKVGMDYNLHSDKQTAGYQEKQDANTLAMAMLGLGTMPSADTLAKAGISSADAQAMVNKVKENEKKNDTGGDGGGGGSKVGSSIVTGLTRAGGLAPTTKPTGGDDGFIDGVNTNDGHIQSNAQAKFSKEMSPHSENMHDAIMRDMYGSYTQYLAEMIDKSSLTDAEKIACIKWYAKRGYVITERDANFKPKKQMK